MEKEACKENISASDARHKSIETSKMINFSVITYNIVLILLFSNSLIGGDVKIMTLNCDKSCNISSPSVPWGYVKCFSINYQGKYHIYKKKFVIDINDF